MAEEVTLDFIARQQQQLMDRFEELALELRELRNGACMLRSIVAVGSADKTGLAVTAEITTADELVAALKTGPTKYIYRATDGTNRITGSFERVSLSLLEAALKRRLIKARWDSKDLWSLPERIEEARAAAKSKRVRALEDT